jgi:addiction module HigA family antidote
MMSHQEFAPVTPGEMLKEEFLAEYGLSQNALEKAIDISPNRIAEIVNNRRRITADTALRLGLYFGNSPELARLGARKFDHFRPLLGLHPNQLPEVCGGAGKYGATQVSETKLPASNVFDGRRDEVEHHLQSAALTTL